MFEEYLNKFASVGCSCGKRFQAISWNPDTEEYEGADISTALQCYKHILTCEVYAQQQTVEEIVAFYDNAINVLAENLILEKNQVLRDYLAVKEQEKTSE